MNPRLFIDLIRHRLRLHKYPIKVNFLNTKHLDRESVGFVDNGSKPYVKVDICLDGLPRWPKVGYICEKMINVKQIMDGDFTDSPDGNLLYKGKSVKEFKPEEGYPWNLEAKEKGFELYKELVEEAAKRAAKRRYGE